MNTLISRITTLLPAALKLGFHLEEGLPQAVPLLGASKKEAFMAAACRFST
jgi:hypothetical protein